MSGTQQHMISMRGRTLQVSGQSRVHGKQLGCKGAQGGAERERGDYHRLGQVRSTSFCVIPLHTRGIMTCIRDDGDFGYLEVAEVAVILGAGHNSSVCRITQKEVERTCPKRIDIRGLPRSLARLRICRLLTAG